MQRSHWNTVSPEHTHWPLTTSLHIQMKPPKIGNQIYQVQSAGQAWDAKGLFKLHVVALRELAHLQLCLQLLGLCGQGKGPYAAPSPGLDCRRNVEKGVSC